MNNLAFDQWIQLEQAISDEIGVEIQLNVDCELAQFFEEDVAQDGNVLSHWKELILSHYRTYGRVQFLKDYADEISRI
tara:strand:- start:2240 stop:2473 length:234 start_codon:yes stop_codon:yes gene_type:complete